MRRLVTVSVLAAALVSGGTARAHHSEDDAPGLSTMPHGGATGFHFRDARVEALGEYSPRFPVQGQPLELSFSVRVKRAPYTGPVQIALVQADGSRVDAPVTLEGALFKAHIPLLPATTTSIRIELVGARGAAVILPLEVTARVPLEAQLAGLAAIGATLGAAAYRRFRRAT